MKATGIVRRVDDLGRVVIPKEIRRNMGVTEGTPLEVFVMDDGGVVFKKYIPGTGFIERIEEMELIVKDISEDLGSDKTVKFRALLKQMKELYRS